MAYISASSITAPRSEPLVRRIHHLVDRVDLVGLVLFAFGFGLLLVPFSLAAGAEGGYKNRESTVSLAAMPHVRFRFRSGLTW